MNRKKLERDAYLAIMELRRSKLKMGFPFMINTDELPLGQCYLEYPDGSIKIVTVDRNINDFKIVSELSFEENNSLRRKLKLSHDK